MTSKLEARIKEFKNVLREYWPDEPALVTAVPQHVKVGAKWLLEEAQALAFPQGTEDQVVRLSDLKKLVGEDAP